MPGLGGVVLVEAVKRLYSKPSGSAAAPVTKAVKASRPKPVMPRKLADRASVEPSKNPSIDLTSQVDTNMIRAATGGGQR